MKKKLLLVLSVVVFVGLAVGSITRINLATQVMGNLDVSHLNSGSGATGSTFWRGDGTWASTGGGGGYDPGFAPSAGAGLTLNIAASNAFCTDGNVLSYPGGTLSMADNTTNYVLFSPLTSGCGAGSVASNTSGFLPSLGMPIAKVVTSGGAITGVTDYRFFWLGANWTLPYTSKGELVSGTGSGDVRGTLAGTNGQCLEADSTSPTGISYQDCTSVSSTTLIDIFPSNSMKGSFVGADYWNTVNRPSTVAMWNLGPTQGTCGNRSFFPDAGWLRNLTLTTITNAGDGQSEYLKLLADCTFQGIGGAGLVVRPGNVAGGYGTRNGLYRVEQLNSLDFEFTLGGSGGAFGTATQFAVPGMAGAEYIDDTQATGGSIVNIIGGFGSIQVPSNGTYYSGPGYVIDAGGQPETYFPLVMPFDGTANNFVASMSTNNGNAATTVTLRKNTTTDTALVINVAAFNNAAPSGQAGGPGDLTHSVALLEGDTIDWSVHQAAGASSGVFLNFMLAYVPTNGTSAMLWGSFQNRGHGGTNYFPPFGWLDSSTELQAAYTMPRAGVASKLYLYMSSAVGAGQSDVFTVRKNGADTALTCTTTDSTPSRVVACDLDPAHAVTFAKFDRFDLKDALTGGAYPPGTWSLAVD